MASDNMSVEFATGGEEIERSQQALEVKRTLDKVQRNTVNIDLKGGIGDLAKASVVITGIDAFSGETRVAVVAPQISSNDIDHVTKAQNTLVSKGLRAIYQLVHEGKISESQAEKLRAEMSIQHAGIDAPVQNEKKLWEKWGKQKAKTQSRDEDLDKPKSIFSVKSSPVVQGLNWRLPALSAKDMRRKGIIMVSGFALTACSFLNQATPTIPSETQIAVTPVSTEVSTEVSPTATSTTVAPVETATANVMTAEMVNVGAAEIIPGFLAGHSEYAGKESQLDAMRFQIGNTIFDAVVFTVGATDEKVTVGLDTDHNGKPETPSIGNQLVYVTDENGNWHKLYGMVFDTNEIIWFELSGNAESGFNIESTFFSYNKSTNTLKFVPLSAIASWDGDETLTLNAGEHLNVWKQARNGELAPEVHYNKVTGYEVSKMSVITPEDLKPGSTFDQWEEREAQKLGVLCTEKNRLDLSYYSVPSDNSVGLSPSNIEGTGTIRSTEFLSLYRIKLDNLGFPGKEGFVATYVQEDKNGDKIRWHFLLGEEGIKKLASRGFFADKNGQYFQPTDKLSASWADILLLQGKPGSPDDIRPLAKTLYGLQNISTKDVKDTFQRIANTDSWGSESEKDFIESTIWLGASVVYVKG